MSPPLSKATGSIVASVVSLVVSFGVLIVLYDNPNALNYAGVLSGLYGIVAAAVIQLSSNFEGPATFDEGTSFRVPVTLYIVGAASVFYSLRITVSDMAAQYVIDPFLTALANALIISLVTGWIVYSYIAEDESSDDADTDTDTESTTDLLG